MPAAAMDQTMVDAYHAALHAALAAGWVVLSKGGPSLDAVTIAVMMLEDDPLFNAGHGAVFTSAGMIEMDAAIMSGNSRAAGAVAGICVPRNPILAARAVMEHSGTVLMMGSGAEEFLASQNIEFVSSQYFATERRLAALQLELARRAAGTPDIRSDADRHGTVGAVARDLAGNLAAGTSTGGFTAKRPGRVGDTPVIGAGTFADNCESAPKWGSVGVDGPTASCAKVELFKSNERAARMKFKRIAIDTSKHVFTIHGVDERDQPILRRELKRVQKNETVSVRRRDGSQRTIELADAVTQIKEGAISPLVK